MCFRGSREDHRATMIPQVGQGLPKRLVWRPAPKGRILHVLVLYTRWTSEGFCPLKVQSSTHAHVLYTPQANLLKSLCDTSHKPRPYTNRRAEEKTLRTPNQTYSNPVQICEAYPQTLQQNKLPTTFLHRHTKDTRANICQRWTSHPLW